MDPSQIVEAEAKAKAKAEAKAYLNFAAKAGFYLKAKAAAKSEAQKKEADDWQAGSKRQKTEAKAAAAKAAMESQDTMFECDTDEFDAMWLRVTEVYLENIQTYSTSASCCTDVTKLRV